MVQIRARVFSPSAQSVERQRVRGSDPARASRHPLIYVHSKNHKYREWWAGILLASALHRAEGGKDNEAGTKTGANAEPPMAHGPWRQHFSHAAQHPSCARSRVLSKGNMPQRIVMPCNTGNTGARAALHVSISNKSRRPLSPGAVRNCSGYVHYRQRRVRLVATPAVLIRLSQAS